MCFRLGNFKLPLCGRSLLVLCNPNFRKMLNLFGRGRLKVAKKARDFADWGILEEHFYRFLQVFLGFIDSFTLTCNAQSFAVGNIQAVLLFNCTLEFPIHTFLLYPQLSSVKNR